MYSEINSRAKTDPRFSSILRPLVYFSPEFRFCEAVRAYQLYEAQTKKKSPKGRREVTDFCVLLFITKTTDENSAVK